MLSLNENNELFNTHGSDYKEDVAIKPERPRGIKLGTLFSVICIATTLLTAFTANAIEKEADHEAYFELTSKSLACQSTIIAGRPTLKWEIGRTQLDTRRSHDSVESELLPSMTVCESLRADLVRSFSPGLQLPYVVSTANFEHCYPKDGCRYVSLEKLVINLDGIELKDSKSLR